MRRHVSARLRLSKAMVQVGLAIMVVSVVFGVMRVDDRVQDLQLHLRVVEVLAKDRPDLKRIQSEVAEVRKDLADIRSEVGWLLPIMPLLAKSPLRGWLPQVGGDLAAAPHLLDMSEALVSGAEMIMDGWSPLIEHIDGQGDRTPADGSASALGALIDSLQRHHARLEQAQAQLKIAGEHRARITTLNLSRRTEALLERVDRTLPLLSAAVDGSLALPALLGFDRPRSYLILVQNSDELRATGGFISAAGQLTVERGKLTALKFMDSYQVDNLENDYPEPPEPLQTYMLAGMWLFRDANWSPDFPTSARQAADLYAYGQGKSVPAVRTAGTFDGVIALDQEVVRLWVKTLGPLDVAEMTTPLSDDNLVELMRSAWIPYSNSRTQEVYSPRKDVIGNLARALHARLTSGEPANWLELARATYKALREKHLLVYVKDPTVSGLLTQLGWDGAVRSFDGDYLLVVDSNVGFTKVNPLVNQSFDYAVTISSDPASHPLEAGATRDGLTAKAALSIGYQLQQRSAERTCDQKMGYRFDALVTYESMMDSCYWDYLRVYTPKGSQLRGAKGYPIPEESLIGGKPTGGEVEELSPEAGKEVLATIFLLERGGQRFLRFEYDLPRGIVRSLGDNMWRYSLYWQKQPGTPAIPTRLTVTLPGGSVLVRSTPAMSSALSEVSGATPTIEQLGNAVPAVRTAGTLHVRYQLELTSDFAVELIFQRK